MDRARKREFKNAVYEQIAVVGKALASPRRLEILDLLSQAERSVEQIAEAAEMSVANTSQHLQVLRTAGLVRLRRDGVRHYYELAGAAVYGLWATLRNYADDAMPEIDRVIRTYLEDRTSFESIDADELRRRLSSGDVVLLDVRPRVEFDAGHIPGARSTPVEELEEVAATLPDDREIVAYCRGRYCVYSDEAVRALRARGFRARRFAGNPRDWEPEPTTG